jgi:protein involved in polysaccharide export with SLBB domain
MQKLMTLLAVLMLALLPMQMEAQAPSGEQIRAQIRASGLTPAQIRDRLAGAGYDRALLDSYLGEGTAPAPAPSLDILDALSKLSVAGTPVEGVTSLPLDSGVVDRPRAPDDGREGGVKIFGLDVFRGSSSQFQPLLAGPVPDSYRLGAGDLMVLVVSGDVELVHNLEVTRDGFILIPQVGQLYVGSLTMGQVKQVLRTRLGAAYSGIRTGSTLFDVTLARLRTNQVYVIGEVVQPGAYQLASVATVLNALYAAGGPTERAGLREVRVERAGQTVATLDLYDYLLRGDTKQDVTLEMGDVVFLPVHRVRVTLTGAVVRPAIYELTGEQTMRDLIAFAGGFRPDASLRRISVSRIVPPSERGEVGPDRIVVDVPVSQVTGGEAPPFALQAGDEVRVYEVPSARRAMVDVEGAVYQPGTFGWRPGLRLSEVVRNAGGLRPAVYSQVGHIERLNAVDSTRYLVRVQLPTDSLAPWPEDPELQDYDVIRIFAREDFRSPRTVRVDGFVNHPGVVPYAEGMSLRDLLMKANGLRDGAFLDSVEIARLPADRSSGQMARIVRVALDSTYLFEREGTSYRFLPGPEAPASGAREILLEPYDRVTVFPQPEFEFQRVVTIAGEVRLPGPYALRRKDERLSSLVARAGGTLATAYVQGARLIRTQGGAGRVDIELAAALSRAGGRDDLVLQPGDSLTIPEYSPVVRVEGAVNSPSAVQYRPGRAVEYYIANAGGWTRNADRWQVSVRAANGSAEATRRFLLVKNQPSVGPGSVITVHSRPDQEPFDLTAFLSATAQILASTVAIIVIATR